MSTPGPTPTGLEPAEPFATPGSPPNPAEVPPSPAPFEDPVTEPDVIDPGVGMPLSGREPGVPHIPAGPIVA